MCKKEKKRNFEGRDIAGFIGNRKRLLVYW